MAKGSAQFSQLLIRYSWYIEAFRGHQHDDIITPNMILLNIKAVKNVIFSRLFDILKVISVPMC